MPECLICGKPTIAMHLGMDACRACTVFFRRNRGRREKLKCINGNGNCTDYRNGISSCRKCRLARFDAVMDAGRKKVKEIRMETVHYPSSSADSTVEIPEYFSSEINMEIHETSADNRVLLQTGSQHIIERIRVNYRALSIMRRTAEFQVRGIYIDPFEADKEEYEISPCTYQIMNEATRILITGLFDFIPAVFPEFATLAIADKWLLVRNYQRIFHCIDAAIRITRRWGLETEICLGSYTTSITADAADVYFSDCPDKINVADAARTLRDCLQENCNKMKKYVSRMQPSEDEFLSLLGLAFCSIEIDDPKESVIALASRYRTEILSDLMSRYRQTSSVEEGTVRIGELFGLLQSFKKAETNLNWEYEIYRILNVFDDDTYMYKMQMHRPDIQE